MQLVNTAFLVSWLQNRGIDSGLKEKKDDLRQHEEELRRAKGTHLLFGNSLSAESECKVA